MLGPTRLAPGLAVTLVLCTAAPGGTEPTVSPRQMLAGARLTIADAPCPASQPARVLIASYELVPAGDGSRWSVAVPLELPGGTHSVRWKCGGVSTADAPQIAVIEIGRVVPRVARVVAKGGNTGSPPGVELGDSLELTVDHLEAWRLQFGKTPSPELHLFVNGIELKGVKAQLASLLVTSTTAGNTGAGEGETPPLPDSRLLAVTLDFDEATPERRESWIRVLREAMKDHDVQISVGPDNGPPFPSDVTIRLSVFPAYTIWVVALLALLVVALFVLGKKTNLLRDGNGAASPPYSLAKHQMAAWLVVVVGAYLCAWLITGQPSALSATALTLIGISGSTGLFAAVIDTGKRAEAAKAAAAAGVPLERGTNRHWFLDLLSDANGLSFHRLQMFVWTIVLLVVFVKAVWTDVVIPDFDATLLGLMGISSGTYLAFKLPEEKAPGAGGAS
jgi:hypothetical protein